MLCQSPPSGKAIYCCGNLSVIKSTHLFWTYLLCWSIRQSSWAASHGFSEDKDVQWQRGGLFCCTPQSYSHLDFGLVQSWILGGKETSVLPWECDQTPGWRVNSRTEFRIICFETRIWPVQSLERLLVSISCHSFSCPVVAPREAWSKHWLDHMKETALWLLSEFHCSYCFAWAVPENLKYLLNLTWLTIGDGILLSTTSATVSGCVQQLMGQKVLL